MERVSLEKKHMLGSVQKNRCPGTKEQKRTENCSQNR